MVSGIRPTELRSVDDQLFFKACDTEHGCEIWRSDGTEDGTHIVRDVWPGARGGTPEALTAFDDELYFFATDPTHGTELWRTDGSRSGTVLVKDIRPGRRGSKFTYPPPTPVGDSLFFWANDGEVGRELWRTDGTGAGTVLVKDITPGSSTFGSTGIAVGSTMYFGANDGTQGWGLWRSDGTEAGTQLVSHTSSPRGSAPIELTEAAGTLFFLTHETHLGLSRLWRSDGSAADTIKIAEFPLRTDLTTISRLTAVGETLYFDGYDERFGSELWTSDGTESGTRMVRDINPGSDDSTVFWLTAVGNLLYFQANDATNSRELWRTDGTEVGTVMVEDCPSARLTRGPWSSWPVRSTSAPKARMIRVDTSDENSGRWIQPEAHRLLGSRSPMGLGPARSEVFDAPSAWVQPRSVDRSARGEKHRRHQERGGCPRGGSIVAAARRTAPRRPDRPSLPRAPPRSAGTGSGIGRRIARGTATCGQNLRA